MSQSLLIVMHYPYILQSPNSKGVKHTYIRSLTLQIFSIEFLVIIPVNCSNPHPSLLCADNTRMKWFFPGVGMRTKGHWVECF